MLTQPLGGCPMGETVDTGAVNHLGEVFDGSGGVHRGLYVADASIIPAPLGVGPLLTVAALAERCAGLMSIAGHVSRYALALQVLHRPNHQGPYPLTSYAPIQRPTNRV
jgi:choline dehydrogenase-like flavoprotein